MRHAIVHRNARRKRNAYNRHRTPTFSLSLWQRQRQRSSLGKRTLGYLDALDRLVIHCCSALFDELVSFYAKIENLGAIDAQLDELSRGLVDNVCCRLKKSDERNSIWSVRCHENEKATVSKGHWNRSDLPIVRPTCHPPQTKEGRHAGPKARQTNSPCTWSNQPLQSISVSLLVVC